MKKKVITDEPTENIRIHWDDERFCIANWENCYAFGGKTIKIILNPREAQEIADFINENNTEYQRELQEKKLRENIERLS